MRCFNEEKWMDYFDGELPSEECQQMDLHMETCVECASYAKEMKKVSEIILALPALKAPSSLQPGIHKEIEKLSPSPKISKIVSLSFFRKLSATAALFLLFLLGGLLLRTFYNPPQSERTSISKNMGNSLGSVEERKEGEHGASRGFILSEKKDAIELLSKAESPRREEDKNLKKSNLKDMPAPKQPGSAAFNGKRGKTGPIVNKDPVEAKQKNENKNWDEKKEEDKGSQGETEKENTKDGSKTIGQAHQTATASNNVTGGGEGQKSFLAKSSRKYKSADFSADDESPQEIIFLSANLEKAKTDLIKKLASYGKVKRVSYGQNEEDILSLGKDGSKKNLGECMLLEIQISSLQVIPYLSSLKDVSSVRYFPGIASHIQMEKMNLLVLRSERNDRSQYPHQNEEKQGKGPAEAPQKIVIQAPLSQAKEKEKYKEPSMVLLQIWVYHSP